MRIMQYMQKRISDGEGGPGASALLEASAAAATSTGAQMPQTTDKPTATPRQGPEALETVANVVQTLATSGVLTSVPVIAASAPLVAAAVGAAIPTATAALTAQSTNVQAAAASTSAGVITSMAVPAVTAATAVGTAMAAQMATAFQPATGVAPISRAAAPAAADGPGQSEANPLLSIVAEAPPGASEVWVKYSVYELGGIVPDMYLEPTKAYDSYAGAATTVCKLAVSARNPNAIVKLPANYWTLYRVNRMSGRYPGYPFGYTGPRIFGTGF